MAWFCIQMHGVIKWCVFCPTKAVARGSRFVGQSGRGRGGIGLGMMMGVGVVEWLLTAPQRYRAWWLHLP
jgi:hypothetical protein